MVRNHHERFDGIGYPDGLKGDNIPYFARVMSIIDAYDAMVSKRSYKDSFSEDDAKKETIKNAGTQFDPELVEIFLGIL